MRHAPPTLHVVLASRDEPPFPIERLRGQGQVVELTAARAGLHHRRDAPAAPRDARRLRPTMSPQIFRRRAVAGPRPCGSRSRPSATSLPRSGGAYARGPATARWASLFLSRGRGLRARARGRPALVRTVAPLDRFNAELCEALGVANAAPALASLERRGLFVESDRSEAGWYSLGALVREFARESMALSDEELRDLLTRAAAWLEAQGFVEDALRALRRGGRARSARRSPRRARGGDALGRGGRRRRPLHGAPTRRCARARPSSCSPAGRGRSAGEWEDALAWYARAADCARARTGARLARRA